MKYKRCFLLASVLLLASALFFACKHDAGGGPDNPGPGGEEDKGLPRDGSFLQVPASTGFPIGTSKTPTDIKSFWMCEHEVTQAEYKKYESKIGPIPSSQSNSGDNFPVENVTWLQAITYCNERSKQEGLPPCYTINTTSGIEFKSTCDFTKSGYRLPTAAEWEYAARAGIEGDLKYSGAETPTDTNKGDYAWYEGNSAGKTHEVMKKKPNKWGFYDMNGNVAELIWRDNTKTGAQTSILGGSYDTDLTELLATGAVDWNRLSTVYKQGFRVCRNVTE